MFFSDEVHTLHQVRVPLTLQQPKKKQKKTHSLGEVALTDDMKSDFKSNNVQRCVFLKQERVWSSQEKPQNAAGLTMPLVAGSETVKKRRERHLMVPAAFS